MCPPPPHQLDMHAPRSVPALLPEHAPAPRPPLWCCPAHVLQARWSLPARRHMPLRHYCACDCSLPGSGRPARAPRFCWDRMRAGATDRPEPCRVCRCQFGLVDRSCCLLCRSSAWHQDMSPVTPTTARPYVPVPRHGMDSSRAMHACVMAGPIGAQSK